MKMNLDMSFEEGMNVVNSLRECAINNGWDEDELDECGVIEEYTSAVDAALSAMGISVSIDSEPTVDEEQDEDEDEEAISFNSDYEDEDDEEDDEDDDELPSDDEVFRMIRRVLYGR